MRTGFVCRLIASDVNVRIIGNDITLCSFRNQVVSDQSYTCRLLDFDGCDHCRCPSVLNDRDPATLAITDVAAVNDCLMKVHVIKEHADARTVVSDPGHVDATSQDQVTKPCFTRCGGCDR